MQSYSETNVTGTSWKRCPRIELMNALGAQPLISLSEEQVISVGGLTMNKYLGQLVVNYNPTGTIDVYDPVTGDKTTSTISHNEIMAIFYSIYRTAAEERDAMLTGAI